MPNPTEANLVEGNLDEERHTRVVAFFDGQNVLRTSNEVFGFDLYRPWDYDPRKLVGATVGAMEAHLRAVHAPSPRVTMQQIRFYTGVPTFEKDIYARSYWERLFNLFRDNGIVVTSRDLRYYRQGPPREKGIDLRIGLDIVRLATGGLCDAILLFSQDTDLFEAIAEAKALRARHAGALDPMYYFCAFPRNADPETHHGVGGTKWIPLDETDFEPARYPAAPRVNVPALIKSLERRHRKQALHDFDLVGQGRRVTGTFLGCHRVDDETAVLIIEAAKAYLFIMNVRPECPEMYNRFQGIGVTVLATGGHTGRLEVDVRPV